jgi:glycosyltransferase involved in cell wall biosynthesis
VRLRKRQNEVIHYVWFNNQHVLALVDSLNALGVAALKSKPKFPKQLVVILLAPIYPVWYRLSGTKIIHIHWVAGQFLPPRIRSDFGRNFFFYLFCTFLYVAKILGLKIVWTAHNLLPHEKVFPDDLKARRKLVGKCSAILAFDEGVKSKIHELFSGNNVKVIPAAEPPLTPTETKAATRERLGIQDGQVNFVALGHVRHYKAPDVFLRAAVQADIQAHLTLAGAPGPADLMAELTELVEHLPEKHLSATIKFDYLSDGEFANLLQAADFLVCPFRKISNSGIVNNALELGIPLILPNLPELAWVPKEAALWFEAQDPVTSLAKVLQQAQTLSSDQLADMQTAAQTHLKARGWSNYVRAQADIYRELIS